MTWTIKIRGTTDRPIAAEYLCPVHGRFAVTVDRDANGDAPSLEACPEDCGAASPYAVSAPRVGVRRVEAVKGGWEKPARKTFLDTRNLGEGQDIDEWREDRARIRDQQRRDSLKELIDG